MAQSPFTDHPASVGETYTEHLAAASSFALAMLLGGVACLIHGVLPFLFVKTGSTLIAGLHDRMVVNRRRHGAGPGEHLAGFGNILPGYGVRYGVVGIPGPGLSSVGPSAPPRESQPGKSEGEEG